MSAKVALLLSVLNANVFGQLKVLSPLGLKEVFEETQGEIAANFANFGRIPYG
jgi:hypothetical protein